MISVRCELGTMAGVLENVQSVLPEARLREQRSRQLVWHVPHNVLPISEMFRRMETARQTNFRVR